MARFGLDSEALGQLTSSRSLGIENLCVPPHLIEVQCRGAQKRVPKREREQHVCIEHDDKTTRYHLSRNLLYRLVLDVITAEILC